MPDSFLLLVDEFFELHIFARFDDSANALTVVWEPMSGCGTAGLHDRGCPVAISLEGCKMGDGKPDAATLDPNDRMRVSRARVEGFEMIQPLVAGVQSVGQFVGAEDKPSGNRFGAFGIDEYPRVFPQTMQRNR